MNIGRICRIMKEEGLRTFGYLLKEKTDAAKSEENRYQDYVEHVEPRINDKYLSEQSKQQIDVISWDEHSTVQTMKEAVSQCDAAYIGCRHAGLQLHKDATVILNAYIGKQHDRGKLPDVIYGNEDVISLSTGDRSNPIFRPEYSPDTLWSYNYIGDFACIRKERLESCLGELESMKNPQFAGELLYAILLQLSLHEEIHFEAIHTILTHRVKNTEQDGMNLQNGRNEHNVWNNQNDHNKTRVTGWKQQLLDTHEIEAQVRDDAQVQYIDYAYHDELVSIVIPSKDNPSLFAKCMNSIQKNTEHASYEVILVDNGSSDIHRKEYQQILDGCSVSSKYLYQPMDFNFAKMCNIGAANASGKLLLFLNDDIEILPQKYCTEMNRDWLEILAAQAMQKKTGAVGAKLMYPDSNKIQHIGVVNYEYAGLAHIYARSDDDDQIKDYRNRAVYNYLCVTGACLMVETKKFKQVNGFYEGLAVTHNDIDLCFHLYREGYLQVQRNDVILVHHESFSRGIDEENKEKEIRNMKERDLLYSMYPEYERWDPYYSPCLSQLEFDSRINPAIYSIIYRKPELVTGEFRNKLLNRKEKILLEGIHAKITSAQYREDLQIYGYAYDEKGERKDWIDPTIIIYNDQNAYKITARSLCDRVFHERKGTRRHINFAPFYCGVNTTDVKNGIYVVNICDNQGHAIGEGTEIRIANKK